MTRNDTPSDVEAHTSAGKFRADVLWNVGSLGVLGLCGIALNLVIAGYMGPEALGLFNQVFAIYILLSQFAVGGLQFSVLKHVSHSQAEPEKCAVLTGTALSVALLMSGLACVLAVAVSDQVGLLLSSPGVASGIRFASLGLVFFSCNKIILSALNGVREMKAFAVLQASRMLLILAAVVVIIWLQYPAAHLAWALTIAECVLFIAALAYLNACSFGLRFSLAGLKRWSREHFVFGMRGLLGGVFAEANTRVDVLMLGYFSTDRMVGIYAFAAMLVEGIAQLPVVMKRNVDPILGQHFANGEMHRIEHAAKKVRRVLLPIMTLLGIGSVLVYPVVLTIMDLDEGFGPSWGVFSILMIGVVINAAYRPFVGLLLIGGRPGLHTICVSVLLIANVMLNSALIPVWGIYGAAGATACVFVLQGLLLMLIARRVFGIAL